MKKLNTYLEEAIENIRNDRDITKELLNDLIVYLSENESRHKEVGTIAAKYVETLQRSNEQLVKIASLLQKKQKGVPSLSEMDKEEIYDILNGENN